MEAATPGDADRSSSSSVGTDSKAVDFGDETRALGANAVIGSKMAMPLRT